MAALDKAILDDLHVGNAEIRMKDYSASDWNENATLDFSTADIIYTAKDTFEVNQATPSVSELKLDQNDTTYASIPEAGEFTIAGLIPSVAQAVFDKFANPAEKGASSYTLSVGNESFTGKGYSSGVKKREVSLLVISQSRKSAIVFAKVDLYAAFTGASDSAGAGVQMAGTVVSNPTGPDYLVLKSA